MSVDTPGDLESTGILTSSIFLLVVLGLELRNSHLLGKHSASLASSFLKTQL
jgi:hypothetical protein